MANASFAVEIRGHIATGSDSWDAEDFAGLYYDIDDNIKTEDLTITVTDRKLMKPDGVVYITKAMEDSLDFDAWGNFLVIGFLAEKYFTGYVDTEGTDDILFQESDDENVLADKQLLKILVDNDDLMTVTSGTPLKMKEGYVLGIRSIDIDDNKVYLELSKDGAIVDSKAISPSKTGATMEDKTYYYKKDVGDSKDVVIVAAHFKNAFRGADLDLATIDGLWQLSDTPTDVSENAEYDKMTIQTVTSDSITMNNEGNDITLSNGKDISLMGDLRIRTADPSADEGDVLRYYVYKEITEPGTYEIRGNVATGSATWNANTFPGFYYDIDDNIETEELVATVADRKIVEPDGIIYTTKAEPTDFEFEDWGQVNVMAFLAEKYFSGYLDTPDSTDDILFEESDDENVLVDKQLLKILVDNDDEITVTSGSPLKLEEGYELAVKSIDIDGNRVSLELTKDGVVVDNKVISPSKDGATMLEKTYYYRKDIGDSKDVVIVAAHFKNAFRGADLDLATVDGLWQLSDTPIDVSENTEYDKMTIQTVTADSIMMNNEDNDINLSNGKDISLMGGVRIKTADPSADEGDVLRWYIYKKAIIEGEGAEAEPTAEAEAAVYSLPDDTFFIAAEEKVNAALVPDEKIIGRLSRGMETEAKVTEMPPPPSPTTALRSRGMETEAKVTESAEAAAAVEEVAEPQSYTEAFEDGFAVADEKVDAAAVPEEIIEVEESRAHRKPSRDRETEKKVTESAEAAAAAEEVAMSPAVEETAAAAATAVAADEAVNETAEAACEYLNETADSVEEEDAETIRLKLKNGTIIEVIPLQMKVGVQRQVVVAISRTPNLPATKTVTDVIVDIGNIKPEWIQRSELPVYKSMKVNLVVTPDDFDIKEQHTSDLQHIPKGDFATWRWLVTPRKDGLHQLDLAVCVFEPPFEKVVYLKTYDVEVNYPFVLEGWVFQNYQWIFGSLFGSGIILWLLKRRNEHK